MNNLRLPLFKYMIQGSCFRGCFCSLYRYYSVRCKTPTELNPLNVKNYCLREAVNVDIYLDVFLVCCIQNEDENRASESKKTKLEEKAPSGHKTSSSRE